jgi:pimeloyl-ACP methyl ester carboxylesterase
LSRGLGNEKLLILVPLIKLNSKLGKGIVRMLVSLLIFYVLICVAGCAWQRRLIYFPTKLDSRVADEMAAKGGFRPWRNKTSEVIGWKLPASSSSTGSVLVVHGNAGCALNRDYFARPIHEAASCDVYVLEYPGYGARAGAPSMKSFLPAGEEAIDALPKDLPIYVVSESLGTGVAAHLAKVYGDRISGLMLFAPYNNLASVGQRQMPYLPVSLILRERFNPAKWLTDYRGPVSFVIAGADEVIPPDLGRKLHDGYAGPKRLQVSEGAHHNDVAEQSPEWWKEVFSFWQQHRRPLGGSR